MARAGWLVLALIAAVGAFAGGIAVGAIDAERLWDLAYEFAHAPVFVAATLGVTYLVMVAGVRWRYIALPYRAAQRTQATTLLSRVATTTGDQAVKSEIEALLVPVRDWTIERRTDAALWSSAAEIEAYERLHAAELLMVALSPSGALPVRLRLAAKTLHDLGTPRAKAVAAEIDTALAPPKDGETPPTEVTCRVLLEEAVLVLTTGSEARDALTWHRKSFWLAAAGVVVIVALAGSFGRGELFLAGAAGAVLSRLFRAVRTGTETRDYWAWWVPLLLAPVAGALAAYVGLLFVSLLRTFDVVGDGFAEIGWDQSTTIASLGIAALLGFSERLLDRIIEQAEPKVAPPSTPPSAPPPVASGSVEGGARVPETKRLARTGLLDRITRRGR